MAIHICAVRRAQETQINHKCHTTFFQKWQMRSDGYFLFPSKGSTLCATEDSLPVALGSTEFS